MKHKGLIISWNRPFLHNSFGASLRIHQGLQACTCFLQTRKIQYCLSWQVVSNISFIYSGSVQTSRGKGSFSIFFTISLAFWPLSFPWLYIMVIFLVMTGKFQVFLCTKFQLDIDYASLLELYIKNFKICKHTCFSCWDHLLDLKKVMPNLFQAKSTSMKTPRESGSVCSLGYMWGWQLVSMVRLDLSAQPDSGDIH